MTHSVASGLSSSALDGRSLLPSGLQESRKKAQLGGSLFNAVTDFTEFDTLRDFMRKNALITGAASGIGRAIALALAREGTNLWLVDKDEMGLADTAEMAKKFEGMVKSTVCDLAEPTQVTTCVEAVLSTWGRLNILVNNAAVLQYGRTHQISTQDWDRTIATNLLAPIQLVRELLPILAIQDEAHILNVCSFVGLAPFRKIGAYQTSKFGLVGFTQALRSDYTRHGLGVTALCPGFVRTPMLAKLEQQTSRHVPAWMSTTAEEVARTALAAMRNNRGLVVMTPVARLAWWLTRLFPGMMDRLISGAWQRKGKVTAEELQLLENDRVRAAVAVGARSQTRHRTAHSVLQTTLNPAIHESVPREQEVPTANPE